MTERTEMTLRTNLKGLKRWAWKRNLKGYFIHNGRELSDKEVRRVVEWGIAHGCETELDIPSDIIPQLLDTTKS